MGEVMPYPQGVLRFLPLLMLLSACPRATPHFESGNCEADTDCALVLPCCSCCQDVAMSVIDAQTERDRCSTVECRTECSTVDCNPGPAAKAACQNAHCTRVALGHEG